ncbi:MULTISPECIES: flagellar motor switch protein FliM [unclassified Methylobacterium]|jgi:flagellar motor switch protein FliM|uniref:flagellar motor switch protein FliM n=1 Tax=unclassified Methylobacterium TaxID=2615210 RepID=UPI0013536B1C|nr:FliM/FliN family flagellar motor switch protein [Methylobacterium sp. 2A]MWV25085.1 flagellar motor switch protein FliM [Methylobacterium sp. 2A]
MDKQQAAADIRDRLLDAAGLSLERLPMLHVILDRVATACADQLRHFAASPVYFSLSNVDTQRFGDILEPYESNAIAGIFHAAEWDSHVLVGFDRDFIFTMVEVMLGSDGSEPPLDEERSFSSIEMRIAQRLFEQIGKAMQTGFALVADTPFKLERTELRMDFAVIGRRNNQAVAASFLLQALNRGGEMFIIIPQSVLNPMRQSLARILVGETSARDSKWTKQIASEVQKTPVTLKAILEERHLTLGEIVDLKVGQVLELRATPRSRAKLVGNDRDLFWCEVGQADGNILLRVDRFIDQDQEFIDDVLAR